MRRLRTFGRFWWDFVVGDDWRAAAGIVVALGLTAALVAADVDAWWLVPVSVAVVLWLSLRREAQSSPVLGAQPGARGGETALSPERTGGSPRVALPTKKRSF